MGYIYMVRNDFNGKVYIGRTLKHIQQRKRAHLSGNGSDLVKRGIEKYGREHFSFHILHDNIPSDQLSTYEAKTITEHNSLAPNGYNLLEGNEEWTVCP